MKSQVTVPHVFNIARKRFSRFLGRFPIVHLPPPSPDLATQALATKLGSTVPIPPSKKSQVPANALQQRHHHLISNGDVGDFAPRIGILDAGEVRLLEAEIWEWWES